MMQPNVESDAESSNPHYAYQREHRAHGHGKEEAKDGNGGVDQTPSEEVDDVLQEFAFLRAVAPEDSDEDAERTMGDHQRERGDHAAPPTLPRTQSTPRNPPPREPTKIKPYWVEMEQAADRPSHDEVKLYRASVTEAWGLKLFPMYSTGMPASLSRNNDGDGSDADELARWKTGYKIVGLSREGAVVTDPRNNEIAARAGSRGASAEDEVRLCAHITAERTCITTAHTQETEESAHASPQRTHKRLKRAHMHHHSAHTRD
jgi:hypothetical protein